MKTELLLTFDDAKTPRAQFLHDVVSAIMDFTDNDNGLAMLLLEMTKNVYDHAGGKGGLRLSWSPDGACEFSLWDEGTTSFNFDRCVGNSTKVGNGINRGVGLTIIPDAAAALDFKLDVDTRKGFHYAGRRGPRSSD